MTRYWIEPNEIWPEYSLRATPEERGVELTPEFVAAFHHARDTWKDFQAVLSRIVTEKGWDSE